MVKRFFITAIFLIMFSANASAGIKEALNPTKLWELRDELQLMSDDSVYGDDIISLLDKIPELNKSLSRVLEIIPFAKLRIDVVQSSCPSRAVSLEKIKDRFKKHSFGRIAYDCPSIRTINKYLEEHDDCKVINVKNPELVIFIEKFSNSSDLRLQTIVNLCKMVQCEYSLVTLGLSLRDYRDIDGGPNNWSKGLLIIDDYYEEEHLKRILRLVGAESNLR
ncbi:MAG: hypothetical protein U9N54_10805 [candidate division Zixibacteria bacterium]|nr:hypothetical protein [candidate division Zixibacteria bacterium]